MKTWDRWQEREETIVRKLRQVFRAYNDKAIPSRYDWRWWLRIWRSVSICVEDLMVNMDRTSKTLADPTQRQAISTSSHLFRDIYPHPITDLIPLIVYIYTVYCFIAQGWHKWGDSDDMVYFCLLDGKEPRWTECWEGRRKRNMEERRTDGREKTREERRKGSICLGIVWPDGRMVDELRRKATWDAMKGNEKPLTSVIQLLVLDAYPGPAQQKQRCNPWSLPPRLLWTSWSTRTKHYDSGLPVCSGSILGCIESGRPILKLTRDGTWSDSDSEVTICVQSMAKT